jgi:DNA-binding transcriptional LysR family regulator
MLTQVRLLLAQWDQTQHAVAEAVSAQNTTLRVGFQTRIGRGLIPAVTERMAESLPGWKRTFRQVPWRDSTAGLAGSEVDVAIAWLPVPVHRSGHLRRLSGCWPPCQRRSSPDLHSNRRETRL